MKLENLVDHLLEEKKRLGFTQAEIARRSELSPAQISRIFKLKSTPSLDALNGIARAINKPVDLIYEWAGVSSSYGKNPMTEEIKEIANRLEERNLDDLLQYARMRLKIQDERGEYRTSKK